MSASSARRIKEYGGGGGGGRVTAATAAKPSKPITPISKSLTPLSVAEALKKSTGKENPRPTSRGRASVASAMAQKPVIRPLPRIDKSTSSVPRGRSASPSEFNRVLSDLRKDRVSRVAVSGGEIERSESSGRRNANGVRFSERTQQKKGSLQDLNAKSSEGSENGNRVLLQYRNSVITEVGMEKSSEISKYCDSNSKSVVEARVRVSERVQQNKGSSKDLNAKSSEGSENGNRALKECRNSVITELGREKSREISKQCELLYTKANEEDRVTVSEELNEDVNLNSSSSKSCFDSNSNLKVWNAFSNSEESKGSSCIDTRSILAEKSVNAVELGVKELSRKPLSSSRGSEILKQKALVEESVGGGSNKKYPSRLHEKLAFLEGKVKRIASDIKKTKEMLDLNNPDASKVILSDIQEKISGIEKAMEHVNGADGKIGIPRSAQNDDLQGKTLDKSQNKEVDHQKSTVKGLNTEELEARLFPHHKLIRDRTSLKVSSESTQNHRPVLVESGCVSGPEEKLLSPIDENIIAAEFLASLNKEQSKITMRGENVGSEFSEVQETEGVVTSASRDSSNMASGAGDVEISLTANETLDEFDNQENRLAMTIEEEPEDSFLYQLNEIGYKTSTGGWFVSEGEAVLLAHDDGSCSFYDITNCEEKAEYKPPVEVSPNIWRDCWIIRAPGADGCPGRYVVAASAGNTLDSGFCSWDFYNRDVRAFHIEDGIANSRTALAPLPNNAMYRRNTLSSFIAPENQQWWYKPSGPLIISTASCQRAVRIHDIRDGEQVMKWEVQKPVLAMHYSSPLQWRNRGKVVVAEAETISLWDVNSLNSQALLSISSFGRKVSALHVNNTDAEPGGGVRQRVSSSEAEGNDGVFCTPDSINILDFREPSGVGLKIPKLGVNVQSVFSRGDSIFLGCSNARSAGKKQPCSQVQQFSLRKQRIFSTYSLPESSAHSHHTALTQVWGNSNFVIAVCGLGLFVFDASKDDGFQSLSTDYGSMQNVREVIGPDDLFSPSFDYMASRVLLISRDRPALWRYLS